jgi:CYTH domain-containing protein
VLVASVQEQPGMVMEVERGFIVPNDWRERANQRVVAWQCASSAG